MQIATAMLVGVAVLGGVLVPARAAENYTCFTGSQYSGSNGTQSYGLAGGVLVCEQTQPARPLRFRPVAWFGAVKPADGPSRLLYLLIFKAAADVEAGNLQVSFEGQASTDRGAEGKGSAGVGPKRVEVAYKFATDPRTKVVVQESLAVGGRPVKEGDPRVWVVDLTGDTVTYTPVRVGLPKEAPDVSRGDHEGWGAAVRRAVDQLKKDSPELKKLLEP